MVPLAHTYQFPGASEVTMEDMVKLENFGMRVKIGITLSKYTAHNINRKPSIECLQDNN